MKLKILLFFTILVLGVLKGQLITWTPVSVTEDDSVIVYFDATQGSGGLAGYTGDVYAHTGVLTDISVNTGDWKAVKTNWGQNTPETKCERIAPDLYKFVIRPSVKEFYPLDPDGSDGEEYLYIAFVFRSATSPYLEGKTADGGDIFLPMGSIVKIFSPEEKIFFVERYDNVTIKAIAHENSDTLKLFIDDILETYVLSDTLDYIISADDYGIKNVKVSAFNDSGFLGSDSFAYVVSPPVTKENLPASVCQGINYTSDTSVVLVLFAPNKKNAFVLGDFNDWKVNLNYYMKRTLDDSTYWLQINGLNVGEEYAYQYLVDEELFIADPYTDKILDPWNDKYITSATYPDLKAYPTGKATGIVSVLQTAQTPHVWNDSSFIRPAKTDLVIYELLIRDFRSQHTFQSVIDSIPYLKRLGVNAIELMPVNEFEGNNSWGYNPSFYFAPDKYYGPKNKLKELIDVCHQNGIAVIMDIVLNHSYGQSPLVKLYWDEVNNRPAPDNLWYNFVSPNPVYSWGYDFNHQSPHTKAFVDSVNKYWLIEYHFDGFRFDFTKGFTNTPGDGSGYDLQRINILKRMADKIYEIDSTYYVILEHFAPNTEEIVLSDYGMMLWGNMNYNYGEASMGWNQSGKSNFQGVSYKYRNWNFPHLVGYMESHDEERIMYKNLNYGNLSGTYNIKNSTTALNRIKLISAFFFTIPGPKMIWQFEELGYDYSIDYNGRTGEKPIRWDYYQNTERKKLYKTMKELINLKKNYEVFRTADFWIDVADETKEIHLNHPTMNVTILGNFDVINQSMIPNFQHTGTWYEFFRGDSIIVADTAALVFLKPGEFRIYTTVKLPTPEEGIATDIKILKAEIIEEYRLEQNYPNPFNPKTLIRYAIPLDVKGKTSNVLLKVYDILGQEVTTLVNEEKAPGIYQVEFNAGNLTSGIYMYRIQVNDILITKKMILLK
ncbi:MAG: T9SS type A sorting domain-containing protein [Ignavibacteriales bacterium]|nr:T9SS type A sorting domain-containing protein [Ignavibacteriales bacterium]